ncbi:hypothetical protein BET03_10100 [Thermohalobacter berrensis]|uniref:Uncharacterized protein n=2 Tax=Thermohalobacter berrensis TaxID=99594 RepID=A0A419T6D8_9FIRM|nr:hypothetical protein BET03_10100 [Thermohalobacter berrensis]
MAYKGIKFSDIKEKTDCEGYIMEGNLSLEELKVIIEEKRYQLNTLLKNNDTNREKALKLSVELDKLICKYYSAINKSN